MKKNVLIIGSQGYLGSRLIIFLKQHGYNCSTIDTGFFKNGLLTSIDDEDTISKDARSIVEDDLKSFDSVILLAGISNDPFGHMSAEQIYDPTRDYALKIASICKKLSIQFIYPSSCSVYGAGSNEFLNEDSQTNPQTPYSVNKIQVEEGLASIADENFTPIALRLGTVYGLSPRIRFDVVINMLCGLVLTTNKITLNSNGMAWRPHLHIDDACQSFMRCLDWNPKIGELITLNVGQNQDNYKILDIANIIHTNFKGSELNYLQKTNANEDELLKDRKIQDGVDTRSYKVLFDKIENTLPDFKCKWDVERGIVNLLDDLKKIGLTKSIFNTRDFYRLQQIEYLHENKKINDDLFWYS